MTLLQPVDEITAARVLKALRDARTKCMSPVATLNQAGLLMTDHHANLIRRDVLLNAAQSLRDTRMRHLQERKILPKEYSPLQVARAMADLVEGYAVLAERGEF